MRTLRDNIGFALFVIGSVIWVSGNYLYFDIRGWPDLLQPTFADGGHAQTFLSKKWADTKRLGEFSVMTLNVEEFFEPCVQIFWQWVSTRDGENASWTVAKFAETRADVLEGDFVKNYGNATATVNICQNMTEKMWDKGVEQVAAVIAGSNADIVLLQEVAMTRLDVAPRGYKIGLLASSGEGGWKDVRIGNLVLVRDSFELLDSIALDLNHGNGAPRVAACVEVQGPKPSCVHFGVCSLHLSGGRFDDELWEKDGSADLRTWQLEFLLNTLQKSFIKSGSSLATRGTIPLVLGGDFNAQFSPQIARPLLMEYSLYKQAVAINKEDIFLKYMTNGHDFLRRRGFRPTCYPKNTSIGEHFDAYDTPHIEATSKFGAVVDWVYYQPDLMRLSPHRKQVIHHTIQQGLSDHDSIQAFLQLPASKCRPKVVTAEMKAFWSGVGMALPSMLAMWLGYPFETIRTRQSTVAHIGDACFIPPSDSFGAILKLFFWIQWPARLMATYAAGVSTFIFWFAFYAAQSSGAMTMKSTSVSIIAASANVVITQPAWTVITNMQVDTKCPPDTWDIHMIRLYSHRGLLGFWAGATPNLLLVGFPVLQGYCYQTLTIAAAAATGTSDFLTLDQKHPMLSGIAGGIATVIATILTYPLHVLRSRWQADVSCLPEIGTCRKVLQSSFLGFRVKLAHSVFTSMISFAFKEQFFAWVLQG
eukprot:s3597_g2.t1